MRKIKDIAFGRVAVAAAVLLGAVLAAGCDDLFCDTYKYDYTVHLKNGTSEPLYYMFSDDTIVTPEKHVSRFPVYLAGGIGQDLRGPSELIADRYYDTKYLIILRYDYSIVGVYDLSATSLHWGGYPWLRDSNYIAEASSEFHDFCGGFTSETITYTYTFTDDDL